MKNNFIKRRSFLKQSGLISAGILAVPQAAFGNTIASEKKENPSAQLEKKLDAKWIRSLYDRGTATTYLKSRNELAYIGMPVGGIQTGMVYLGGDGRLWLWDVFNKNQTGVVYKNIPWHEKIQFNFDYVRPFDGANYVEPVKDVRPLEQGFAIRLEYEGKTVIKRLQQEDWEEIAFEATYPMATIRYMDAALPVAVVLKAYSPFIPLDEDDSGLPATILSFSIENKSNIPVKICITGWLENKSCLYTAIDQQYFRVNKASVKDGLSAVLEYTDSYNWADEPFKSAHDYGNFCLASLNENARINTAVKLEFADALFTADHREQNKTEHENVSMASVGNDFSLKAGETKTQHYVIAWYYPNLTFESLKKEGGRYYANRFKSSVEVADYIRKHFERLSTQTSLWCDTWYRESTLPYWFLERTFLNISTLATTTCHRFQSGRFYAWEGVGSCPGTCNHVWQYAHAMARIFPALERDTRERVDLGVAFHDDGHIGFRGEYDEQPSIDGQAGRILGIYREHQMSVDDAFLKRNWPRTKQAIQFVLKQDTNGDGMIDTQLENTLDAKWPGEIAWIVGLGLACVKAGQRMAEEMNDTPFASQCKTFVDTGKANLEKLLFNGEYFIHRPDATKGKTVIGSYDTCHIDQVYGQSWAHQVGLGRVTDKQKTLSALHALWKYNFTTDVGPYLKEHHGGRPYALPGEGGMIMNTNPKRDPLPYGVKDAWQVTYFHECMSGFEHQVAAHMMAEGMTEESLILTRTIHDRYHAAKRNPFNEVECSDHYARAMASYGTFITACGFEYHGPKQYIKFAPRLHKESFKAPFTVAQGWGTYAQNKSEKLQEHHLEVKYGTLTLQNIGVEKIGGGKVKSATVRIGARTLPSDVQQEGTEIMIVLKEPVIISTGEKLSILM